jgi:hypothetical protein
MNLRSDGRIHSVGRDQSIGTEIMAAFKSRDNTVGILLERFKALTWSQAPFRQLASKRLMQIGPMYAQGRTLKPGHRDCRDQLSVWTEKVELGDGFTAGKHLFEHSQGT